MKPPALPSALVRLLAEDRCMVDDLAQEFEELAASEGASRARRWYWRQALKSIGPLLQWQMTRVAKGTLHAVVHDVRYSTRLWRRSPVPTTSLIVAIALGIGASTAIFTVMEAVFLRPLPFPDPQRLVQFSTTVRNFGFVPEINFLDAGDLRAATTRFAAIGLYDREPGIVRLRPGETPQSATLLNASAEFTAAIGITPLLGRDFRPDEFNYGGAAVVLLGHRFWQSHFGGDRAAVGRTMIVGSVPHEIVGVLPPEADRFPAGGADAWTPLAFPPTSFLNQRGSIALAAIGRLRPDATFATAQEEVSAIADRLARAYPATNEHRSVRIAPLQNAMVGPVRPMMLLLGGSIAMLLAVACANIANLLLAQAHARSLEFGIRAAVGASRARLVAQLWTESLVLFAVAGTLGVAMASPLARSLVALYPGTLPLAGDVRLDARVLMFAIACTLAAALLAGLPRMRRIGGMAMATDVRSGSRAGLGREQRRMTRAFVAAQVTISMVLLFSGLLLLKTFVNLSATRPGFDPDGVVTIRASIPAASRTTPAQTADAQDALAAEARRIPGVTGAAHAMFIPFAAGTWGDGYTRVGAADPPPAGPMAHFFMVSPEYLRVMGLPVLRGRGLEAGDRESSARVLVVSDTFARRAFPGESAVGRRINWNDDVWEIVGVAADMRHESLAAPFDADVYVPRRQVVRGNTWLLLKTSRPPAAVLQEVQERARRIDPAVALTDAFSMQQRLDANAAPERFRAIVTGTLAGLTLLLAVVGLHGVVCYAVTQRTREIGVRLALGQRPSSIVWTIMRDTLGTIAVGALPGVVLSVYAGRWLSSVVMVDADSTAALAAVVAIIVAAALIAAAGPALRASRVDPVLALRT